MGTKNGEKNIFLPGLVISDSMMEDPFEQKPGMELQESDKYEQIRFQRKRWSAKLTWIAAAMAVL